MVKESSTFKHNHEKKIDMRESMWEGYQRMIEDTHLCKKGASCSEAKKFLVHFHLCKEEKYYA